MTQEKNNSQAETSTALSNQDQQESQALHNQSRRNLLKGAGLVGAAVVGAGSATRAMADHHGEAASAAANYDQIPLLEARETLTAEEARTLEVICDLLIPSDRSGPGAKEARAVHYIDRSLAAHNSGSRHNYMVSLAALNDFSRKKHGKAYYEINIAHQLSLLHAVQQNKIPGCAPSASGFFNMVRGHTIDGTFCDPYYGGNQKFVGWDMVNYPGIRLGTSQADVAKGRELAANHQSAYDNRIYTKDSSSGGE